MDVRADELSDRYVTLVPFDVARDGDDLRAMADELFGLIGAGTVQVHVNQRYPLSDLARAHRDLEARATTGSTVLLPG